MIKLLLVNSQEDKIKCKEIIEKYHSYVPTYKSVGRRIDWLIYNDDELIGMIGVGSSTYPPCKDILSYLHLTKKDYAKQFNTIANNWRFCLIKQIKNIGTQILKEFRNQAKIEWKNKYDNELNYIITFVGGNHKGSVYKADNWLEIGNTAGLPPHKSCSMKWNTKEELKDLFLKPDKQYSKKIFIKKL